jgi:hypothetical protein
MAKGDKGRPEPLDGPGPLRTALMRTADGDVDPQLQISLRVSGGAPSQRHQFNFTVAGGGRMSSRLDSDFGNRHAAVDEERLQDNDIVELVRRLRDSEILDLAPQQPRFLPDTLVGMLDITRGPSTFRVYFAADADQAAVQGKPVPEPVRAATAAIYDMAAAWLAVESVAP